MQLLHHFPMSIMSNVSHITHQNVQNIQNIYLFGKYWECTLHTGAILAIGRGGRETIL